MNIKMDKILCYDVLETISTYLNTHDQISFMQCSKILHRACNGSFINNILYPYSKWLHTKHITQFLRKMKIEET